MRNSQRPLILVFAGLSAGVFACGTDSTTTFPVTGDAGTGGVDGNASGGDTAGPDDAGGGGDDAGSTGAVCDPSQADLDPAIRSVVYTDTDTSDRSFWDGAYTVDTPVGGLGVSLIGPDGVVRDAVTCDDGSFAFGGLADGVYVTDIDWPDGTFCTTRNCTRRFPEAVRSGRVKIVTLGDSVPVQGAPVTFPARLAELLAPVAEVENLNIAMGGTVSTDWTPGTSNFDNRLAPHIESADVIIVSIGGNDFLNYANGAYSNPADAIAGFPDFVREVMERVLWVKDEVRFRNPDVDLVYLLYPDYSQSAMWEEQFRVAIDIIRGLVADALEQVLDEMAYDEDVIVVDFYGYFREHELSLDPYLFDMLHFNDPGQDIYTEQIFLALGGVRVGADPVGMETHFGLTP